MLIPLKLIRDHPLQEQLYEQLLGLMQAGRLQQGTRMPSTRMLADQFSISRTTVLLTYERLIAEGWLETLPAAGTFVARRQTARPVAAADDPVGSHAIAAASVLAVGAADPALFPTVRWRTLMRGVLDNLGSHYTEHPGGNTALRAAVAGWLSISRGIGAAPEQIILVNSRQHAVHIAAHMLLAPGRRAVVEDPSDPRATDALTSAGAVLRRIPTDAEGLCTSLLPDEPVSLIHVSPEHHRMLGVRLPLERRLALLQWATQSGAVVLEEDCDGDLRSDSTALPSLMSLDARNNVILVGGFGTSLGPWLTLGYMVVPVRLIDAALAARHTVDDSTHRLEESALAEFISSGGYARHVHRVGKTYGDRRAAMIAALEAQMGPDTAVWAGGTGLHLTCFPSTECRDPVALATLARRCGLEAAAAPAIHRYERPGLLLGFGRIGERRIEDGIARWATLLQRSDELSGAAD